ncbi:histidine kinase dimerization/phospho-acceptor domain-containing protein, partial [Providencia rettgeri]|uniref:histidine kinase dimerization/phospho-acceptor domain-containing protein n=3 Tax=Bacteria TaxID=2 RepID=UPI0029DD1C78
ENLRQVSADVAHDLRSPLARLRGGMESALAAPEGPMRDAAIARAIRQSDDLLALFAGILHIVDVDAGDVRQRFAPLDLGALV